MILKNISFTVLTLFLGTVLVACGDDTDKSSGKMGMEEPAMPTTTEPAMGMGATTGGEMASETMEEGAMVEGIEDNGVIYQDEIYKNWPYQ